jgi:hypothetical protein
LLYSGSFDFLFYKKKILLTKAITREGHERSNSCIDYIANKLNNLATRSTNTKGGAGKRGGYDIAEREAERAKLFTVR